jgi:hypothetical protein
VKGNRELWQTIFSEEPDSGTKHADIDLLTRGTQDLECTIVFAVDGYNSASETRTFEILPRPGN